MTEDDPRIGRVLDGRYRIVGLLGTGGIGAVYRAEHAALGRFVAVKVLLEDFSELAELQRRFVREAKALSALSHPHIVPVIDFGLEPEPYLVMELLEGRTLEDLLRDGLLAPARALDIARQVLRGLAFAHARGVAHRDLKPANVFLQALPDADDHVRLLDFGLARFLDDERGAMDATLTKVGMIFGTPAYMAPEQATGERADARADVYSAGILLYELLTGRRPFNDPTRAELLRAHLLTRPPAAAETRPGLVLSAGLEALLERALAKNLTERFADGGEMLAALDALPPPAATIDARLEAEGRTRTDAQGRPLSEAATLHAGAAVGPGSTAVERPARKVSEVAPRRSLVEVAGFALAGLGLLSAAGYVVVRALRAPDADTAVAAQTTAPTTALAPEIGVPAAAIERPAARDPWVETAPAPLALARAQLARHEFRESDLRPVREYVRDHRDDARGHLVFARAMTELGWRSDALSRYRIAFSADLSVRGDPAALEDVASLAETPSLHAQALRLLRQIWAEEAPPLLEAAAARATEPARQSALRALRAELAGSSR